MQDSGKVVVLGNYLCLHPGWKCVLGNGNQEIKLTVLILSLTGCALTESSTAEHSEQHINTAATTEYLNTLHYTKSVYFTVTFTRLLKFRRITKQTED